MRALLALLAPWFALLVPLSAAAESVELPIELEWRAPPGCPRAADVLERIEALAGSSSISETPARAEATVRRIGRRFTLKLVMRWGDLIDERNIEGTSCDALAGAAAVNVVLLLRSAAPPPATDAPIDGAPASSAGDPAPAATSTPSNAVPLTAASQPTAPTAQQTEPEVQAAEAATRVRGFIQVPIASVALGPLPGPSLGVSLGGGVSLDAFRFIADATLRLRRRLSHEDRPSIGARVDRFDARVRACRAFVFDRVELAPCLQLSASHLWARGTGAHVVAETAKSTWIGAGAGGQARFFLAPWMDVFAAIDARFESARPRIAVEGAGDVRQLGPVTVDLSAGLEWNL